MNQRSSWTRAAMYIWKSARRKGRHRAVPSGGRDMRIGAGRYMPFRRMLRTPMGEATGRERRGLCMRKRVVTDTDPREDEAQRTSGGDTSQRACIYS
jgi:hypothetical protein